LNKGQIRAREWALFEAKIRLKTRDEQFRRKPLSMRMNDIGTKMVKFSLNIKKG